MGAFQSSKKQTITVCTQLRPEDTLHAVPVDSFIWAGTFSDPGETGKASPYS